MSQPRHRTGQILSAETHNLSKLIVMFYVLQLNRAEPGATAFAVPWASVPDVTLWCGVWCGYPRQC